MQKDYQLYGTKILNLKTQEIGLLICIWKNKFADGEIDYATCVDKQGKRYNIELDNIRGFEDDFYKANNWDRVETCEPVSVMEQSKMKVRNKLTKEIINISYNDFKTRFSKEIQVALECYCQTQLNKNSYNLKHKNYRFLPCRNWQRIKTKKTKKWFSPLKSNYSIFSKSWNYRQKMCLSSKTPYR